MVLRRINIKSVIEKILMVFLPINFIGICGFWTFFLLNPSEPITLELTTHIISEYATGLLALMAFVILVKRSKTLKIFLYFSLGLLFYASLQAIGWAFWERMYPLFILMILNMVLIGAYVLVSLTGHRMQSR